MKHDLHDVMVVDHARKSTSRGGPPLQTTANWTILRSSGMTDTELR